MSRATRISAILCLLLAVPAHAERDFSAVGLKTTRVADHVWMLEGSGGFAGGNIAVSAGPDGILIVDDQFAGMASKVRAALAAIDPGPLRFILNTHWHQDHTSGNTVFAPQALVVAHENVRNRLRTPQQVFGRTVEPLPPHAWPVVTFDQSLTIHFNGEAIRAVHFPSGHTDGDGIIFFEGSNVVHMGDHFFAGQFPFVDVANGGNALGLAENIGRVLERLPDDAQIIPGHGPLSSRSDLEAYHRMLTGTIGHVRQRLAAGQNLAQIQRDGLPQAWKQWERGFIKESQWIATIHASLEPE